MLFSSGEIFIYKRQIGKSRSPRRPSHKGLSIHNIVQFSRAEPELISRVSVSNLEPWTSVLVQLVGGEDYSTRDFSTKSKVMATKYKILIL